MAEYVFSIGTGGDGIEPLSEIADGVTFRSTSKGAAIAHAKKLATGFDITPTQTRMTLTIAGKVIWTLEAPAPHVDTP